MLSAFALVFSSFRTHKVRAALTVLAIALSVSLVVAMTSGYSSARAAVYKYFLEFIGSTDVQITRQGDYRGGLSDSVLADLRNDPAVRNAVGRLEADLKLVDSTGKPLLGSEWRTLLVIGVRLPDDAEVYALKMEPGTTGDWFHGSAGNVAVIDQEVAKLLNVNVGGHILLPGVDKQLKLTVVGICHKPQILAAVQQTVYVPLQTLQEFANAPGRVTRILIDLRPGADEQAFAARWEPALAAIDPLMKLRPVRQSRKDLDNNLQGFERLSYLGGTISLLAATFIVFSTLSMGVAERQRILAVLRAVGALKWQIASVVLIEGLLLAAAGALVGVPLGLFWVKALATWRPDYFLAGMVPSPGGILFGVFGSLLTALVAGILPAFQAMRLRPVDAMTLAHGRSPSSRPLLRPAAAGLILILIDPILIFARPIPRSFAFYSHFILGLPCLMLGFFLLAPLFVWLIEKTLARAVAFIFRVKHALLAQQLTGAIWRAAGTAAALMVGLSILVVMQTHGGSLLKGWRLPDKFPDMFIFAPLGLSRQEAQALETVEGIRKGEVLPIAIAVSGLDQGFLSVVGAAILPDATMFLGVDPDKAMKMMQLDFREGSAPEAARLLKQERYLIVTDEFRRLKGLGVGGKMKLKTPKSGQVDYTIAAVVASPGVDVFVAAFDLGRQFDQRSALSVFSSMENAERDFGVDKITLFAANLDSSLDKQQLEQRIQKKLGAWGLRSGDVREIKRAIQQGFHHLLMLITSLAVCAIAVASLGVTNTIMASIRTRLWHLGILRSIGLTRWQLLRLILAEALLLGLVGAALGLAAGLEMSINANGLSGRLVGYSPRIIPPWPTLALGTLAVIIVALLASLFPALAASRQQPLDLLQAGRAAA